MFNKKKREIEELKDKLFQLNQKYSDTYDKLLTEQELNKSLSKKLSKCKQCDILQDINNEIASKRELFSDTINQIRDNNITINQLKLDIIELKEKQQLQSFGFYDPIYIDKCSDELKELIKRCRDKQKQLIKYKTFYTCDVDWHVNGNYTEGNKLILDMAKTSITSFNLLCDSVIDRVSVANLQTTKDKITKLFNKLDKQLNKQQIHLNKQYLDYKLEELDLMYSLALAKEEEKEQRRIEAERIKEQEEANIQLEKERTKLEKDLKHYEIQQSKGNDVSEQINEIQKQINENEYFLTRQKCGYLYIINNPSLGKDVYKIGLTRRLPRENDNMLQRVDELSNSSIPFKFTQNCIMFSEDVFGLETALHKEFNKYRVNKINKHKEFFKLPLQEIERIVKEKYESNAIFNYDAIDKNFLASNWNLGENFLDK